MTPDCYYVDSSTFQKERHGRAHSLSSVDALFKALPDSVFYPQAGPQGLPYWDFFDDQVRITVPWRWIARLSHALRVPDFPIAPATRQNVNHIGVDRYLMSKRTEPGDAAVPAATGLVTSLSGDCGSCLPDRDSKDMHRRQVWVPDSPFSVTTSVVGVSQSRLEGALEGASS